MGTHIPDQIENEFAHLSTQAQLRLLERLIHRLRVTASALESDGRAELPAMAADAEVQ